MGVDAKEQAACLLCIGWPSFEVQRLIFIPVRRPKWLAGVRTRTERAREPCQRAVLRTYPDASLAAGLLQHRRQKQYKNATIKG